MFKNKLSVIALVVATLFSFSAVAEENAVPSTPEDQAVSTQQIQPKVDAEVDKKAEELRKKIRKDAVVALNETKKALRLLDENKTEEALKALEQVTGKLELILAREPKLALAPVDVEVFIYDLFASAKTVKSLVKQAEDYLEDGKVQAARPLLANLNSEIVISTTNIPLGTYPEAIKNIVPLLDKNDLSEAKSALQAVLNTLVITDDIIPLPSVRAEALLKKAEALAEKSDRSDEENKQLKDSLSAIQEQIELAEALGYGDKKAFKGIYKQVKELEKKTADGKSGEGWFDKIKKQVSDLFE